MHSDVRSGVVDHTSLCEICVNPKNKWSKEAQDYDSLVKAWTNLQTGAREGKTNKLKQGELI